MSKERLIELAKQAGWEYADDDRGFEPLWAFAELVRADERARMAEQPAQQEPEYIQLRHKEEDGFSPWGQPLDPKYRHDKWAAGVEMRLLFTSPQAQRTWVGLTDEEREIASWADGSFGAGARWADAKLKEKNT